MNASSRTKPVMDVAAPKKPVFAPAAAARSAAASILSTPARLTGLASRQNPSVQSRPNPAVAAAPRSAAERPKAGKAAKAAMSVEPAHQPPTALLTVTVFVALVLAAIAVTVYVTTRSA